MRKIFLILTFFMSLMVNAQLKPIPYGDFETWAVHYILESRAVGGQMAPIYIPAPTDTIVSNKAYTYADPNDMWTTSNGYVDFMGLCKTSLSVTPDPQGDEHGTACKLEVKQQDVVVLGLDVHFIMAGTLFMGRTHEPFVPFGDNDLNIEIGVPIEGCPKAVVFDYKAQVSPDSVLIQCKALGKAKYIKGFDCPEVYCILQRRWEDAKGNIYAERVGTVQKLFPETTDWVNGFVLPIHFGPIENPVRMELFQQWMHQRNSKGKNIPIKEVGWAPEGTQPTHICLSFASSCLDQGGTGHIGNTFWIDNVGLLY